MRATIKNKLPAPLANLYRNVRDHVTVASEYPAARFHPWRVDSIHKLEKLHNCHQGERCVIIGNGPSLKQTDLSKLRGTFTFGMNRFYMAFPDLGFPTSVLLTVNDLVIEQCASDLRQLSIPTFVSWRSRNKINPAPNLHYLYTSYILPRFNGDATGRLWEGATVTFVAMQLAYFMGFKQVILIGVDHNFTLRASRIPRSFLPVMIQTIFIRGISVRASAGSFLTLKLLKSPINWQKKLIEKMDGKYWMLPSVEN